MRELINAELINANETLKILCFAELINANGGLRQLLLFEKNKNKKERKILLSYKNFKVD